MFAYSFSFYTSEFEYFFLPNIRKTVKRNNDKILTNQIQILDSKLEGVPPSAPFQCFKTAAVKH